MKKLALALALLALVSCSGKKWSLLEGPFRANFQRPFSIQYTHQRWSMPIFFDGVLPKESLHIEGYLVNNGTEYFQHHSDIPPLRSRMYTVHNKFTSNQYCEAIGRPMDRFDADSAFWNRNRNQGDPADYKETPGVAVADGSVVIMFKFFLLLHGQGEMTRGKLIAEALTRIQLECPMCRCGGQLR